MDAYSRAHLREVAMQIDQALKAGYTYKTAQPQQQVIMLLGESPDEE